MNIVHKIIEKINDQYKLRIFQIVSSEVDLVMSITTYFTPTQPLDEFCFPYLVTICITIDSKSW